MKVNKLLKVASVAILASTLAACGKEKVSEKEYKKWAEDNGYVLEEGIDYEGWAEDNGYAPIVEENTKPELEMALGTAMSQVDVDFIKAAIGGFVGTEETFGEKKDMVIFYGINECPTCAAAKVVVNKWVEDNGFKIYYFNPDESAYQSTDPDKINVLKKLGSADGTTLVAPVLAAFVDGDYQGSIGGDDITEARVNTLISTFYNTEVGEKTLNASKELNNLSELRTSIANGEQFLLYATRFNCPWCRKFADTARDNNLNKFIRAYEGNLYTIVSEKVLMEMNNLYVLEDGDELTIAKPNPDTGLLPTGAVNAWTWIYSKDNGATPDVVNPDANKPSYWPNATAAIQKAEVLLYAVATGEIAPHVTDGEITDADQVAFLKEIVAYAASEDDKKFTAVDRLIPAFVAVGWTEEQEEANKTAIRAAIARESNFAVVDFENNEIEWGSKSHHVLFPEYFIGVHCGEKNKIDYVTPQEEVEAAFYYLMIWANSWTYNTAAE